MTAWGVAAALAVGLALIYRLVRARAGIPLLRATIGTSDGYQYSVAYEARHPNVQPVEYVWITLYFAAKMLYILNPKDSAHQRVRAAFVDCIGRLADAALAPTTDVSIAAGHRISVSEVPRVVGSKQIAASLSFANLVSRKIHTSIPMTWFEYQFLHSWLALVQTILPKLDTVMLERLNGAMKRLARMYRDEGVDPSTLSALLEAPSRAFLEADITNAA